MIQPTVIAAPQQLPGASYGTLLARGSVSAEARASAALERVVHTLDGVLPRCAYEAVVLIGGYGRGEGGVEQRDGEERLHNNLDILVLSTPRYRPSLRRAIDDALTPVRAELGIGVDVGVASATALRRSECLVMWHDMRFGHKTLLGDPSVVPLLHRFTPDAIVPWDFDTLLTNRATLLVLNELLPLSSDRGARRTALKHLFKAIIGYGDALLFAGGRYHASYAEKARRIQVAPGVSPELRVLYAEATEFRFRPAYGDFDGVNLRDLQAKAVAPLRDAHLAYLRARTGLPTLSWDDQVEACLRRLPVEMTRSARGLARGLRSAARSPGAWTVPGLSVPARLGLAWGGPRARLGVTLPAALYGGSPSARELAMCILDACSPEPHDLRRAYVRSWAAHGDDNAPLALSKMGVDLSKRGAAE